MYDVYATLMTELQRTTTQTRSHHRRYEAPRAMRRRRRG